MKTLKFGANQVTDMLNGSLSETWRINDDKDISVDDELECIDKKSGKAFGKALVNEVHIRRYSELDMRDPSLKILQKYYGNQIDPDTHVKIIGFTFTPYKDKEADIDDDKNIKDIKQRALNTKYLH